MAPAPISISWAPGERLLASCGAAPSINFDVIPSLPRPFLSMFFTGHLIFLEKNVSLQEKSTEYRTVILTCKDGIENSTTASEREDKDTLTALSHAHMVWHLIEVVYLTDYISDDRHVSEFLGDWYKLNYPDADEDGRNKYYLLDGERPRDDDDQFWNYLLKLAIVGELRKIRQLLSTGKREDIEYDEKWPFMKEAATPEGRNASGSKDPSPIISKIESLMEFAPDHKISTRTDGSWEDWQSKCAMWSNADFFEGHDGAKRLLGLLSGDTEKIAKACSTWAELFVAYAIYGQYGHAAGGNLHGGVPLVSNACAAASIVYKAPEEIAGGALVEAALGNISNAIVHMEASLPSSWFSAHLCDLLVKAGQLPDGDSSRWGSDEQPIGMREFYLKEFARGLERYKSCWRLAVDYYASCPSHGPTLLIDLLSRLPFEGSSDPTVEKALLICKKRGLTRTARNICERLGADSFDRGNLGASMSWFARAGLLKRAQRVAELALQNAEREGAHSEAARSLECVVDAFTNFGDEKMRELFDYMRVYCDMQRSLLLISSSRELNSGSNVEKPASDFVSAVRRLVGGGGLPRRYWLVVSYEAARVLELYPDHAHLFSKASIAELLGALQLASGPYRSRDMIIGLSGRLAFEAASASEMDEEGVMLSSTEEVESALEQCRSVFVRHIAERINPCQNR